MAKDGYYLQFKDENDPGFDEWTDSHYPGLDMPYSDLNGLLTDMQFLPVSDEEKDYDYRIVKRSEHKEEVLE